MMSLKLVPLAKEENTPSLSTMLKSKVNRKLKTSKSRKVPVKHSKISISINNRTILLKIAKLSKRNKRKQ